MLKRLLSPFFILTILAFGVFGQGDPPSNQSQGFDGQQQNQERPNLLMQLGFTKEQVREFRRANALHRPQMKAAQQRMREANRELDMAIYADSISDDAFQARLKTFQEAQNEVNRLRFENELTIRKILTPDQLVRFREMRRRFAVTRDRLQEIPRRLFQNKNRPSVQDRQQKRQSDNNPLVRQVNRPVRPVN